MFTGASHQTAAMAAAAANAPSWQSRPQRGCRLEPAIWLGCLIIALAVALLMPGMGQGIANIELLNPFNDKDALSGKQPVLDIKDQ